jgi:hypothetical protein
MNHEDRQIETTSRLSVHYIHTLQKKFIKQQYKVRSNTCDFVLIFQTIILTIMSRKLQSSFANMQC